MFGRVVPETMPLRREWWPQGAARAADQMSHAAITVTCAKAANLGHVPQARTMTFWVGPSHAFPQMGRVLLRSARMAVGHLWVFSDRSAQTYDEPDHPA
jgi:hypothetical protein